MEQKILLIELARAFAQFIEADYFEKKSRKEAIKLYEAIKNYEDAV
jgi:hypothetical protein